MHLLYGRTWVSSIDRNFHFICIEAKIVFIGILQNNRYGRFQICTMERSSDRQETRRELDLSLRVRNTRLIKACGCFQFTQSKIQTVQRLRRTSADKRARTVVQGNFDLTLRGKMRVGFLKVLQNLAFTKASDGQHRSRIAFIIVDWVLQNSRI